jgi:hypothetical protein
MAERFLAHFNVARLRYPPGDPRVEAFTSATARMNAVAERSLGYVWRWADEVAQAAEGQLYQSADADPCLAISMSVWTGPEAFRDFVMKTVHRAFFHRRVGVIPAVGRAESCAVDGGGGCHSDFGRRVGPAGAAEAGRCRGGGV